MCEAIVWDEAKRPRSYLYIVMQVNMATNSTQDVLSIGSLHSLTDFLSFDLNKLYFYVITLGITLLIKNYYSIFIIFK